MCDYDSNSVGATNSWLSPLLLACWMLGWSLHAEQSYAPASRQSIGAFLNGRMPEADPRTPRDWSAVVAFPNLTFSNPVGLTHVPGTSRLCVWEREGRVYTFENDPNAAEKRLILDLSRQCQGWNDSGLLGVAFHPDFTANGHVFVWYTWVRPGTVKGSAGSLAPMRTANRNRLSRFTCDSAGVAIPGSEVVMIDQDATTLWHKGGGMFFHPEDGFLYLSVGDDDQRSNAQRIDLGLFSGILRIDVDQRGGAVSHPIRRQPENGRTAHYFIPSDNPFVGESGVLEEFYAIGLRNPHRMTHDPVTGRVFIGDVGTIGPAAREEINVIEPSDPGGLNFQWDRAEGDRGHLNPPYLGISRRPVLEYDHSKGQAIIGGYVYRGGRHAEHLGGRYIFGDNPQRKIWVLDESTIPASKVLLCVMPPGNDPGASAMYTGLSSFGIDREGELYFCQMSGGDGRIYRLERTEPASEVQPFPPLLSETGAFRDLTTLAPNDGLVPYVVNAPFWSDGAIKRRWIALPGNKRIGFARTGEWAFPSGTVFVKHFDLPVGVGNAHSLKRLETRFLVKDIDGAAYGLTYKWREDGREADLLETSFSEHVQTGDGRLQPWYYPSRDDCRRCHTPSAGYVLGVTTRQINRSFFYVETGVTDNQLRAWSQAGMFDVLLGEEEIATCAKLVSIEDETASIESRVRSYFDANCGHCHRPGEARAFWDARFDTPLNEQNIVGGLLDEMHARMTSLEEGVQMPPVARNLIDTNAIAVIEEWIDTISAESILPAPWSNAGIGFIKVPGSAVREDDTFIVTSGGRDIWNTGDEFRYVFQPSGRHVEIQARVAAIGHTDSWAKAGVMIRETLDPDSSYAFTLVTPAEGTAFQRRNGTRTESIHSAGPSVRSPYWVRLVRKGSSFRSYVSQNGREWELVGAQRIPMSSDVFAGLAVTAHSQNALCTARFDEIIFLPSNPAKPTNLVLLLAALAGLLGYAVCRKLRRFNMNSCN